MGREHVLGVSVSQYLCSFNSEATSLLTPLLQEDFALMEASYGIIRIIQTFPNMRLPPDLEIEEVGMEKQALTITLAIANGCRVQLH